MKDNNAIQGTLLGLLANTLCIRFFPLINKRLQEKKTKDNPTELIFLQARCEEQWTFGKKWLSCDLWVFIIFSLWTVEYFFQISLEILVLLWFFLFSFLCYGSLFSFLWPLQIRPKYAVKLKTKAYPLS